MHPLWFGTQVLRGKLHLFYMFIEIISLGAGEPASVLPTIDYFMLPQIY